MSYIRNPKGIASTTSKADICEQDKEDFEQEKLIQEWLEREGMSGAVECKHISRKGTARNTLDKRSIRLDQKMRDEESSGTFADIIAGSDGRDLECGDEPFELELDPDEEISRTLFILGLNEGEIKWARNFLITEDKIRLCKRSALISRPMRYGMIRQLLFERYPIDLELWTQSELYRE